MERFAGLYLGLLSMLKEEEKKRKRGDFNLDPRFFCEGIHALTPFYFLTSEKAPVIIYLLHFLSQHIKKE
jgi:hypothetical protein